MKNKIGKLLLLLGMLLLAAMPLGKCESLPETVNQLARGSEQIEVRFLDCEEKSDASLLLIRTEEGTAVWVIDGGLADGRCTRELEQLRESWLENAGPEAEGENRDLRLHVTLVVTHFHNDHVAELVKNLIPNEHLAVDALYLCEESVFSHEYKPNESKWRKPVLEAMAQYAPDAEIITVPFNTTAELTLPYGKLQLFGPCQDYGTQENCTRLAELYFPEDSEKELKKDLGTAVLNANSLFLRVETPGASVLFPGDSMKKYTDKEEQLDQMIERYGEALRSDIVKYPHHGQKRDAAARAVTEELMNAGGIAVLTGPLGAEQGGKALDAYGTVRADTDDGELIFILTDTGWEQRTAQ